MYDRIVDFLVVAHALRWILTAIAFMALSLYAVDTRARLARSRDRVLEVAGENRHLRRELARVHGRHHTARPQVHPMTGRKS